MGLIDADALKEYCMRASKSSLHGLSVQELHY
jgi:hypothetical protein